MNIVPFNTRPFALLEGECTDARNGERLAGICGHKLRWVADRGFWLVCQHGGVWTRDDGGELVMLEVKGMTRSYLDEALRIPDPERRKKMVAHALRSEALPRMRATAECAKKEPPILIRSSQLDRDAHLLACENGLIDLRSGELLPHDPERLVTMASPVAYDPCARYERFDRFLHECTGGDDELEAFLRRALGASAWGANDDERLLFCFGPAASGKTTLLRAAHTALGGYARVADFASFLDGLRSGSSASPDLARLAGVRFVSSVEVGNGRRLAEGLVKQLTGGDPVPARELYRGVFEFLPKFTLWLCANDAPKIRHEDEGLWRRILRVPFEHSVPPEKRDPELKRTLSHPREGGPAVLAWIVRGCREWLEQGFCPPSAVTASTAKYRAEMDPLGPFIADECSLDPLLWAPAKQLRDRYLAWCEANGETPVRSGKTFAQLLRGHGCEDRRTYQGRGWSGIGFRDESSAEA